MDGTGQTLPRTGAARERLRENGQFWTPDWVADGMVAWAVGDSDHVLDPGVGEGALLRAAKRWAACSGRAISLLGCEIDAGALHAALRHGLTGEDVAQVRCEDFMGAEFPHTIRAIVANPPYVRHHRFPPAYKAMLRAFGHGATGEMLDGRAGLHVFFLIRALTLLAEGGRLAFIVPADTCEGRFAPALWRWIGRNFRVDGAVTFAPEASPFPGVDTNPVVLLIRRAPPGRTLRWAHVLRAGTPDLAAWMGAELPAVGTADVEVLERDAAEAIATGLTRRPVGAAEQDAVLLGDLFRVMRGIATGDNEFFFMSSTEIASRGLPRDVFRRAIGRTRDHTDGAVLRQEHLDALDRKGRPTWLLALGRTRLEEMPRKLRDYLREGEIKGLPDRPLIRQRSPWYRMEVREPPPWLFAYLGRRSCRFIRNAAGALPLTGFLCVYPRDSGALVADAATRVLNDERTLANLALVGKSYGGGALKVEPRGLERLPIPRAVLSEHGLVTDRSPRLL